MHNESKSRSVMSDSLWPHGLEPARLLFPWSFPEKNTVVGTHSLLQGLFPTHISYISCIGRWVLYHLAPPGKPWRYLIKTPKLLMIFQREVFIGEIWCEACRVPASLLIGGDCGGRAVLQESCLLPSVTILQLGGGRSFHFSSAKLFVSPGDVARQASLSVEFSRKECWSGLPFLPLGGLPSPGIRAAPPVSPVLPVESLPQCFQGGAWGEEPICQCRRHKRSGFNPWVRKVPWRREWQLTPVFLPGESPWTGEPGGLPFIWAQSGGHRLKWLGMHILFPLVPPGSHEFLQKNSKVLLCHPLRRKRDPAPSLHCFSSVPPLFLRSLPS